MQRTDNFNLIVVEGSDTVNLLTQMNPNTEVIDEQMFKNQNAGVQTATELLDGTVHAITRSIPDASMIRFTAVSRFTAGDTFTVDGVQVSALLPSGEQLPDGAFIIGSEVLCVLKGTLLTVFASGGAVALAKDAEKLGGQLPSYYATKTEVDSAQETANSAGSLAELAMTGINSRKQTLLWENPNPFTEFASQNVQLSNDDYDYLDFYVKFTNGTSGDSANAIFCFRTLKGRNCRLMQVGPDPYAKIVVDSRFAKYVNDLTYNIGDNTRAMVVENPATANNIMIPYRIYGGKF